MKKKVYRQRKMQRISNQIEPATTTPAFENKTKKRSKGVAGKGGKTTNGGIKNA